MISEDNIFEIANLENFSARDITVFKMVFKQYYKPLCLYASRYIDEEEVEDIVEDVFVNLWKGDQTFKSETHLKSYLYLATRNSCINKIKTSKHASERQYQFFLESEHQDKEVLYSMIEAEIITQLYSSLEKLPPQSQKIIKMYYLDGDSNAEIAQKLNISIQTVKNLKRKGVVKLKDFLHSIRFILLLIK
jgi:RNA polymerase sigma-70 factor (family 1)